jgi:preprotein translocase SecF subunit
MFNFAERRYLFFLISACVIVPGLIAMAYLTITEGTPVKLSIDFTGGTLMEVSLVNDVSEQQVRDTLSEFGLNGFVVQRLDPIQASDVQSEQAQAGSRWQLRFEEIDDVDALTTFMRDPSRLGEFWSPQSVEEDPAREAALTVSSVSATVGKEVTRAAVVATAAVAVIVLAFIVFAFRRVPHAIRYGACAIIAMFHDILVTMGVMAIVGILFDWEADALFLTAILTVVGYSVQDTIVVFDRIRENIPKYRGEAYETIVNRSVLETVHRSFATQLNAVFIMIAIVLFGGETIRQFIGIMLIGLVSGTYSSIFNAVPLLVSWEKGELPFVNREARRHRREEKVASVSS